ncbi:MAG: glycoside hydrolase family 3 N-terminal domain-containing protein [Lachnospiraceae bacterium]
MKQKCLIILGILCVVTVVVLSYTPVRDWILETGGEKTETEAPLYGKGTVKREQETLQIPGVNLTELEKQQEEERRKEVQREQYIEELIENMTLEQKLAQMMILTNEKDITESNLKTYQPGGIIFFKVDFNGKTVDEVRQRVDILQSYMEISLFVGVDEEGGEVSRIAGLKEEDIPQFRSTRELYSLGIDQVAEETEIKTEWLKQMGINVNFDPVADVVSNKAAYMYERSASGDAAKVSEYVKTVVSVMKEQNMGCCLKHFPGYGNNLNTHRTYAADNRELSVYQQNDFLPFQAGIAEDADMVMVSHIVMKCVDEDNPASLSKAVHELLRSETGFEGVVIADDLNMRAILDKMTIEDATSKALAAGNDMIFSADFHASMRGAKKAVEQGELSEEQIDTSLKRILKMKQKHKMIADF